MVVDNNSSDDTAPVIDRFQAVAADTPVSAGQKSNALNPR